MRRGRIERRLVYYLVAIGAIVLLVRSVLFQKSPSFELASSHALSPPLWATSVGMIDLNGGRTLIVAPMKESHTLYDKQTALPPFSVVESASVACGGMVYLFGGYDPSYTTVRSLVQVFNPVRNEFEQRTIPMPAGMAQTHQGIACSATEALIYIVSGQLGKGCTESTR
jgi:hypothetical protein